jgi:hypothetical protein
LVAQLHKNTKGENIVIQTACLNEYANACIDQNALTQMAQAATRIVQSLGFNRAPDTSTEKMLSAGQVNIDNDRVTVLLARECNGPCW